jgi:hypothetical protein
MIALACLLSQNYGVDPADEIFSNSAGSHPQTQATLE